MARLIEFSRAPRIDLVSVGLAAVFLGALVVLWRF